MGLASNEGLGFSAQHLRARQLGAEADGAGDKTGVLGFPRLGLPVAAVGALLGCVGAGVAVAGAEGAVLGRIVKPRSTLSTSSAESDSGRTVSKVGRLRSFA